MTNHALNGNGKIHNGIHDAINDNPSNNPSGKLQRLLSSSRSLPNSIDH